MLHGTSWNNSDTVSVTITDDDDNTIIAMRKIVKKFTTVFARLLDPFTGRHMRVQAMREL